VEQACAYGIEALEALGHLHSRNLLYCDFKVDNAIQTEDQLKLIDLGAVRRMDDDESPVYCTPGYQAPEIAESSSSARRTPPRSMSLTSSPTWMMLSGLKSQ
jgi:serine/threonine-protein kinase PknG